MAGRILIVDDALFMRGVLRNMLEQNGYEVVGEARNGVEAIEKYKELKPDLVTMDITMPDMTGLVAIKKIKEVDSNAKVIMCSAMGQNAMVMQALKSGALDFIVKPFKASAVLEALRRCQVYGSGDNG
ncbi:MAG: response regulator [Butyrivibrio sp.]|nr:response regulator [Acetatifactor muris]MCM1560134.1 response regulator [Butyrivibrio sp.]